MRKTFLPHILLASAALCAALFLGASEATAQARCASGNACQIPGRTAVEIERHGTCRVIRNNNQSEVMVPIRNTSEWNTGSNSFLSASRSGIVVNNCTVNTSFVSATCGQLATMRSVEDFFSAADWVSDKAKTLTIPPSCNVCTTGSGQNAAMDIGTTPWGGDLTLRVRGRLTGGSVPAGNPEIAAFIANIRGDNNQRINILVDGGSLIGGGRHGANGDTSVQSHNGQTCSGSGPYVTSVMCIARLTMVTSHGGAGGLGTHCGNAPTSGQTGIPMSDVAYNGSRQQSTSSQYVNGQWVVTTIYTGVTTTFTITATGSRGANGVAGTIGIRQPARANVTIINGGFVTGM